MVEGEGEDMDVMEKVDRLKLVVEGEASENYLDLVDIEGVAEMAMQVVMMEFVLSSIMRFHKGAYKYDSSS